MKVDASVRVGVPWDAGFTSCPEFFTVTILYAFGWKELLAVDAWDPGLADHVDVIVIDMSIVLFSSRENHWAKVTGLTLQTRVFYISATDVLSVTFFLMAVE